MNLRVRPVAASIAVGLLLAAASPLTAQGQRGGGATGGQPGAQGGRGEGRGGQQRRDAREMAPEGLIGTWVQNMAKSKYDPGPNNLKSQVRQFDYTLDGMILCHYIQTRNDGGQTIGHWIVTLDGKDMPEWNRNSGSLVTALVGIKKTDDHNMAITVRRAGRLVQDGNWNVSDDGKTLTQVLRSLAPDGKVTATNTAVFEKQ
jgi:hypothetical protein